MRNRVKSTETITTQSLMPKIELYAWRTPPIDVGALDEEMAPERKRGDGGTGSMAFEFKLRRL